LGYLKYRYSFDEVVTRLNEHDKSITCAKYITCLVNDGKLESQVLIKHCLLIPVDSGLEIEQLSLTSDKLRYFYQEALQKENNNCFKKEIKREYRRELKKFKKLIYSIDTLTTSGERVRLLSCNDIKHVDIQELRFDEDIETRESSGWLPAIWLSVPVLVSPIAETPALINPFEYLNIYDERDNDSLSRGVSCTQKEMSMAIMTAYTKCKTNFGSEGGISLEYYIVKPPYNRVMPIQLDTEIIGNAVIDGEFYITRDSIKAFEKKYLGNKHSIDDLPAKPKALSKQVQREAVFKSWLKEKDDDEAVQQMTKSEVWELLQGMNKKLFNADKNGFFKAQKLIKFNAGKRPRS